MFTLWYGESEDFARYLVENTNLKSLDHQFKRMYKSDAAYPKNFFEMPDHIKQLLRYDSPDVIIDYDEEPILVLEYTLSAGSGDHPYQRLPRIICACEREVPAIYIMPEYKAIGREKKTTKKTEYRWDNLNPLGVYVYEQIMGICGIPALFYYWPSRHELDADSAAAISNGGLKYDTTFIECPDSTDDGMQRMFKFINEVLIKTKGDVISGRRSLIHTMVCREERERMLRDFAEKGWPINRLPNNANSSIIVPTKYLLNYLKQYETPTYKIGAFLGADARPETVIMFTNAKYRESGDPYVGMLAALDFLKCREGKTYEDRKRNLVLSYAKVSVDEEKETLVIDTSAQASVDDFCRLVNKNEKENNLAIRVSTYASLIGEMIPRYYMQMRYGTIFSKNKSTRISAYFADAIIFKDGAFWRDA